MLGSTLFLGIVFRFTLVLSAERFVKKGNLNHLQQLFWLAWVIFLVNGLVPFIPFLSGTFPWSTRRGQLCLGDLAFGENKNITKISQHCFFCFKMVILAFYGVRYFHKVKKYLHGQCPRQKMSSIGKYQRNIIGLSTTCLIFVLLHCFALAILFFRLFAKNMDVSIAFCVNLICESFLYLVYLAIFIFVRRGDLPTRKEARCVEFNIAKKALEPRRPGDFHFPIQCPNQVQEDPDAITNFPSVPSLYIHVRDVNNSEVKQEGEVLRRFNYFTKIK